jgi:nucleotide-binding universal stress UspA family protein
LPVIYIFTHDSIALGEDGPTHQPVEQMLGLRAIPNMTVIRPADANETVAAWQAAIEHWHGPVSLILTRQKLPVLDPRIHGDISLGVRCGGYVLAREPEDAAPDIIFIATGSEVHLALAAHAHLAAEGIHARVVSMPSWELFQMQPAAYRNQVLLVGVPRLGIEAGRTLGWQTYAGEGAPVIGVDHFGASAPGREVTSHYGLTIERVQQRAEALLKAPANLGNSLLIAVDDTPSSLATIEKVARRLPDPARTEVTLMHYLSPVYWEYGGGDLATANKLEHEAWAQELAEQRLTETYFAQAREILEKGSVPAAHIHVKEEWDADDVADAILLELQKGAFTTVVIGQHHHNSLAKLFGEDLTSILHKHDPGIFVWTIETYPSFSQSENLERNIHHV